jgi:hypothetical protein
MEPDLVEPVQIDYSPLDLVPNGLNVYAKEYSKRKINRQEQTAFSIPPINNPLITTTNNSSRITVSILTVNLTRFEKPYILLIVGIMTVASSAMAISCGALDYLKTTNKGEPPPLVGTVTTSTMR